MKIALGTAQFGMPYGVANASGQVAEPEIAAMLELARAGSVDTLDTAMAYGDSEARLGAAGVGAFRVISKLPPAPPGIGDAAAWVRSMVLDSIRRLRVPALGGLLLHRSQDLLGAQGAEIHQGLRAVQAEGLVQRIGVSIYAPAELDAIWPRFRPDVVQAPYNLLDRRIERSGWLARMKDAGVEVHVRSAFLQGLLLMDRAKRPERFSEWSALWDAWEGWLAAPNRSPLEACLALPMSRPEIDRIVVGADSRSHLQAILEAARESLAVGFPDLSTEDERLIDPSQWART